MAIKGTIGQIVTPVGGSSTNYTMMDLRNPATAKGVVKTVTVQCFTGAVNTPNAVAIKIFRINGSNYDVIYNQAITTMVDGTNVITLTTPQNVLVGDLLGYYTGPAGSIAVLSYEAGGGTGYASYANSNVLITTAIAAWSGGSETVGIKADILSTPGGAAVFFFFKEAWEKHNKLWIPKLNEGFSY